MNWLDLIPSLFNLATTGGVVALGYFALVVLVTLIAVFGHKTGDRALNVLRLLLRVKKPPSG